MTIAVGDHLPQASFKEKRRKAPSKSPRSSCSRAARRGFCRSRCLYPHLHAEPPTRLSGTSRCVDWPRAVDAIAVIAVNDWQ